MFPSFEPPFIPARFFMFPVSFPKEKPAFQPFLVSGAASSGLLLGRSGAFVDLLVQVSGLATQARPSLEQGSSTPMHGAQSSPCDPF